jgi:SAM-dependent methyltransferase
VITMEHPLVSVSGSRARRVLLWGAGRMAERALERLQGAVTLSGVIHNLPGGPSGSWKGLRVSTADAALSLEGRPYVIVCTMFVTEIAPVLAKYGLQRLEDWCLLDEALEALTLTDLSRQQQRWRARLTSPTPVTLHDLGRYDDEFWLWLNSQGSTDPVTRGLVASMPPESVQLRLTGSSGANSLTHGFNQYRIMKGLAERAGVSLRDARRILDFGCGYARIARFFTKDAPDASFIGVDVDESLVGWCRTHLPFGEWQIVPSLPPTTLPSGECTLIVSFSVFTHLSEASQAAWLEELHRWLAPGGIAVVTLWTHPSTSREYHLPHFPEYERLTAEFEAGQFCYSNLCYREGSTYGEAFVPRAYVERTWSRLFDIVEWRNDDPWSPSQTHVALRRR